ncbi:hypothetical protein [Nocardia aurantia]|uniref:Thiolase C-terminal domain-containing protein n=1 Tax=Nocardia aurantia TaxID=2585199 RepID=A0A7K0DNF1_9NOCA|nr:hypothetical protein [Nocardia aurantia]MQY27276.1 hypothetical protein [Nocardia aurantia]
MIETDTAATDSTKYTADEMMTAAAARRLHAGSRCFVGIGLPSTAAEGRVVLQPAHEMRRSGAQRGPAALCIGVGQGAAIVQEGR